MAILDPPLIPVSICMILATEKFLRIPVMQESEITFTGNGRGELDMGMGILLTLAKGIYICRVAIATCFQHPK